MYFGWLAVRGLNPDWLNRKVEFTTLQAFRWGLHAWRECGPWPDFAPFYNASAFTLQLWKIHGKTSVRASERCSANQCPTRFVWSTWPSSNGLDRPGGPTALNFRVGRRGQPLVSVGICWVADLGDSLRQLTLSRNSQSGLWCGRQIAEHPDPREFACYWGTKGAP
jgi:hypothetical protein